MYATLICLVLFGGNFGWSVFKPFFFWRRRRHPLIFTFITNERQRLLTVPLHPDAQGEHSHTGSVRLGLGSGARVPVLEGERFPIGPTQPGVVVLLEADPRGGAHRVGDCHDVLRAHRHQVLETVLTGSESRGHNHIHFVFLGNGSSLSTWQYFLASSQVRGPATRKSSRSAELQASIRAGDQEKQSAAARQTCRKSSWRLQNWRAHFGKLFCP